MANSDDPRTLEIIELDGIMKQESGRSLLLRLLQYTGYFESSYNDDPRRHAFNEGRRDVGLWLYREMRQANPGQLNNMLKEHNNG